MLSKGNNIVAIYPHISGDTRKDIRRIGRITEVIPGKKNSYKIVFPDNTNVIYEVSKKKEILPLLEIETPVIWKITSAHYSSGGKDQQWKGRILNRINENDNLQYILSLEDVPEKPYVKAYPNQLRLQTEDPPETYVKEAPPSAFIVKKDDTIPNASSRSKAVTFANSVNALPTIQKPVRYVTSANYGNLNSFTRSNKLNNLKKSNFVDISPGRPRGLNEYQAKKAITSSVKPVEAPKENANSLPVGWTEYFTPEGTPYYFQESSQTTQWNRPLPIGWTEHSTPEGKPYYFQESSKTTQWNRPSARKNRKTRRNSRR